MPFGSNVNVKIFMKTVAPLVYVYNKKTRNNPRHPTAFHSLTR